jgi:hypothetical protein
MLEVSCHRLDIGAEIGVGYGGYGALAPRSLRSPLPDIEPQINEMFHSGHFRGASLVLRACPWPGGLRT